MNQPWTNPLDRLPQIPQDWANHIVYGGILTAPFLAVGVSHINAALIVLTVSASKKVIDYFKESETLAMCAGKTFVTAAWPASIVAADSLVRWFA